MTGPDDQDTRRFGARAMRTSAAEAVALLGRAAPVEVPVFLAVTVAASVAPIVTAWLTKLVIDRLTQGSEPVGGLALGLAAAGLAVAALPAAARFTRNQIGRAASLEGTDRLFRSAAPRAWRGRTGCSPPPSARSACAPSRTPPTRTG
ncbi:hypothetical protein [Actinomadura logoneensis]|uniref:hypothetical protein n=1 Tax=Actinomadura logoneensis TaxID=2293572 RepID=UPI001F1C2998|nr:hypothetical protein [Actinomadura logoneensis]